MRLKDFWYIAAPRRKLSRKPIRRIVEGEAIVLFRDGLGRPHALVDRCVHRGMALSRGRVTEDCIECPYHGWRYDGTGALRGIPALCDTDPLPAVKPLRIYPVVESQDHVWVWIGREAVSRPVFRFPYYDDPHWHTTFIHTRIAAPLEACLENFLDVPHKRMIHPRAFRRKIPRPARARVHRSFDSADAELSEQSPDGLLSSLLFGRRAPFRHTRRFILPALTQIEYSSGNRSAFSVTSQFTQCSNALVDVTIAVSWRTHIPHWLSAPLVQLYYRIALREDIAILNVQSEQLQRFGGGIVMTPGDLLSGHIRSLRRRAAQGDEALLRARRVEDMMMLLT